MLIFVRIMEYDLSGKYYRTGRCRFKGSLRALLSPDNASGQLDRLEEHIIGLENFPEKFRVYEKEPWHSRGLRVIPVDNYLVFYISDKDARTVTVIRVMYAGRNVDEQLINHTV